MSSVDDWLQSLKLDRYGELFKSAGFTTMESLQALNEEKLDELNISLPGHRNRLLNHRPNPDTGELATETSEMDQLDDLLGNINAALSDLTGLTQDEEPDSSEAPEVETRPKNMASLERRTRAVTMVVADSLRKVKDDKLDSILDDLCSFAVESQPEKREPKRLEMIEETQPTTDHSSEPVQATASSESPQVTENNDERTRKFSSDDLKSHFASVRKRLSNQGQISDADIDQMLAQEKVNKAMQKLAAAQLESSLVPFLLPNGKAASAQVDNIVTAFEICHKLAAKNHLEPSVFSQIVEHWDDLGLIRKLEDHHVIGTAYSAWPPSANNRFQMVENEEKYRLFTHPEDYFPAYLQEELNRGADIGTRTQKAMRLLFQEYLLHSQRVPDIKGNVLYKTGRKYKKKFLILRSSGIYASNKHESEAEKDLSLLVKFSEYDLCFATDPQKDYKSPTEFLMAFKPNRRKVAVDPQALILLAAENEADFKAWVSGVRLAKEGNALRESYEQTKQKLEKLKELGEDVNQGSLVNTSLDKSVRRKPDAKALNRWKSQRADKHNPNISALTGVEFEERVECEFPDLLEHQWYHGALSREDAENMISTLQFETGIFLLRDSKSHKGDLVLTMACGGKVNHLHIRKDSTGHWRLAEGRQLKTVPELVKHYSDNDSRLPTRLTQSVKRS